MDKLLQATACPPDGDDQPKISRASGAEAQSVPIELLRSGISPRAAEDEKHIFRLAQTESPLPPILVHRPSMRIIDGMHRLKAAMLRGETEIKAIFFDGSEEDAFILAVQENVTHGLPLPLPDRKSAAARIISSHPDLSDRAIAARTGLATKTVAALRRRSCGDSPQSNIRRGLDGRLRPLDAAEGRRRAAAVIEEHPGASLREIARMAGVSLGTAHDVRCRLARGEDPVPLRLRDRRLAAPVADAAPSRRPINVEVQTLLRKLVKDPALRQTDSGRRLLRLLHECSSAMREWGALIDSVPPHCAAIIALIAQQYAEHWNCLASALENREKSAP